MSDEIDALIAYNLSMIARLRQEIDKDKYTLAEQLYQERMDYYKGREEEERGIALESLIKWGGLDFNIRAYFEVYRKIIYHSVSDTLSEYGNGGI